MAIFKGNSKKNTLKAPSSNDKLWGFGAADALFGGAGRDLLYGGAGNDKLYGGSGNDRAYGGSGDDKLYGGKGNDQLEGDRGKDRLYGGSGNDSIDGDSGDDRVYGGTGDDYLEGDPGNDYVSGGAGEDELYGEEGNDVLDGGDGHDYLDGETGVDFIFGRAGNDYISGGDGGDYLDGGDGFDVADYASSPVGVIVELFSGVSQGGHAQGDSLISIEGLSGSAGDDIFYGNAETNDLWGEAGNDQLLGEEGDDYLEGGAGADLIRGGTGNDWLVYSSSNAAVSVDLTNLTASGGHADGDDIGDLENIAGSIYGDTLRGNAEVNRFFGGGGADIFQFHYGDMINFDGIVGASSVDTEGARDIILDFTLGVDKLDLTALGIQGYTGNQPPGFDTPTVWWGPVTKSTGEEVTLVLIDTDFNLFPDNGDMDAEYVVELSGLVYLSQSDFLF